MALPMLIPPWLSTRPTDFVEAAQGGLNAGIAAARTWQQGLEESARLAQTQRLSDLAAKVKEEDSQRNFILDQQRDLSQQEYQRAVIAQRKSEAEQASKEAQAKAQAAMQQYQAMQTLGQARRDAERQRLEIERQRLANAGGKPPPLTRDQSIDAQQLKTQISALDKMIVDPAQARNVDALTKRRDELVSNLKLIGKQFGFSPVMGERQEADEASMRDYMDQSDTTSEKPKKLKYTIVPEDTTSSQPDDESE